MTAGQTYAVSVTMQNTGSATWTAASHYRLGALHGGWGATRVSLGAGESIGPGQQKTFTWNVRAPDTAGTHNFQWRMVQEGVAWFGASSTNVAVAVTGAGRNAAMVSETVPTTMTAGQTYTVSVTMQNTGGITWTAASNYRLGALYGNWGVTRVLLGAGDSIAPGQQKTFTWTVRAPSTAGTYNFQWRMLQEGVAWFGAPSANVAVVVGAGRNATFVSQSVPSSMTAGRTYTVSVTMRNTGGSTWTAAENYRLGALYGHWGTTRIPMASGESIAPGQQKTFTWSVRAPSATGTYNFQWRMLQEMVAWFGAPTTTVAVTVTQPAPVGGFSLRFFGTGSADTDRVKIPLDAPPRPVDMGGDFTLEFWMRTGSGNASGTCAAGGDNWIGGNILFDRDVFGSGDSGDYGVSLFGGDGRLAFGVDRLGTGTTICGTTDVADGAWHHVAVTRSTANGQLRIFVDGQLDGSGTGPTGDISYRNGRSTARPDSDPFLVIGAEKHDAGAQFPSYHGWIDEVRLSNTVRYGGAFTRPSAPFSPDGSTVALYHFDEGNGNRVTDASGAAGGPSHGQRRAGGASQGPHWTTDTPFASATPSIGLLTLTSALSAPTSVTNCGDHRLFITEQAGAIRIWDGTQLLSTPFLTVTPLSSGGERGLLSMACHPGYAQNGLFYVYHTDPSGNPTIARYKVSADPNIADANSRVTLLGIPHPGATNHNGGQLQFGSDGYLYAGIGDGGGGCDSVSPGCNAQRDDTLLGKLVRIDVSQNVNAPPYYGIPSSNPFAGAGPPLDEIWSKGLRNPWRFSFDRLTGSLFIGDVGQGAREEINYRPHDSAGGENYGWKRMEGFACDTCDVSNCPVAPPVCNDASYTLPVVDYTHASGCAVTGGYVYRGTRIPYLYGKYLYGDLCSGRLWWAQQNGLTWTAAQFTPVASSLYAFGEDVDGEQYLVRGNGALVKIVPGS
ncbi:MAG: PQQ-dependent sugar dehydrogenase [Candidatus Binatia bacterium]